MTRSRDVSAVQNNLGVAIPPAAAGKNAVINGGFDIAQRGTSVSLAANTQAYTLDRWQTATGTSQACTVSRQSTGDTTNLPNIQYCMRYQRNSGQTGTAGQSTYQSMETINSIPFSGKTVTISCYARKGADYSASSSILQFNLVNGTSTDQSIYSGLTGQNTVSSNNMTLTTTWQRFTYTATVPTNSTQLAIGFGFQFQGTASTNDYFEVTGVQLELGSSATPFSRNGATIQGELAACQRYYFRFLGNSSYVYAGYGQGPAGNGTSAYPVINHPVPMRDIPSSIDYGTLAVTDGVNAAVAVTSITIAQANQFQTALSANVSSGLTQYRSYRLCNNNSSSGYFGLNAEL